ncbi:MAG: MFS transporter [Nocardioidaceae bacterium]
MSPLATYRRLMSFTGYAYVVVAFLGRMPLAMSQLGTLLLVAGSTGSYAAGGTTAGALAVANAVSAPVAGALADRFGQRPVVLVQSIGGAAGLVTVVALAAADVGWHGQAVAAAVTGLLLPQVGPLARVRWRPITEQGDRVDHSRLVDAAFSYEGSADEASFVLGPALVGLAVSIASPSAGLIFAAVLLAVFGSWFALHPTAGLAHRTAAAARPRTAASTTGTERSGAARSRRGRRGDGEPGHLVVRTVSIGMVFGSVQTATSVLATAAGEPGLTGVLHALLGVGGVVTGLAVAVLPPSFTHERRLQVFAVALLLLSLPLLLVDNLWTLAIALTGLGVAVAPYMITVFTLAERITPRQRTGAAMSILAGTTGIGYATGSTIAGRLADWNGHTLPSLSPSRLGSSPPC